MKKLLIATMLLGTSLSFGTINAHGETIEKPLSVSESGVPSNEEVTPQKIKNLESFTKEYRNKSNYINYGVHYSQILNEPLVSFKDATEISNNEIKFNSLGVLSSTEKIGKGKNSLFIGGTSKIGQALNHAKKNDEVYINLGENDFRTYTVIESIRQDNKYLEYNYYDEYFLGDFEKGDLVIHVYAPHFTDTISITLKEEVVDEKDKEDRIKVDNDKKTKTIKVKDKKTKDK